MRIMKKLAFILPFLLLTLTVFAQEKLPNVVVRSLDGGEINLSELENDGKPIIVSFWATWCSPCKKELNAIHELYADWQEETGVKLVAISIDDQRTYNRVKTYVNTNGWEYEVLLDPNSDVRRAMGVNSVPFTFLLNGEGEIVWKHNTYNPGDEEELYDQILEQSEH